MNFLENQKDVKKYILNSKKQDRLSHVYLFSGPKGVGKLDMALYFLAMLWCKEEEPCLTCSTCRNIFNKNFLNLTYLHTNTNLLKTEEIANLQKEFNQTGMLNGARLYIIEDADKMSVDSQNKLLKFIEEPVNKDTYGIFLTTKIDQIIPTIKSRVITLNFNKLNYEFIVEELIKNNVDKKTALLLAYARNNVEECLNLIDDSDEFNNINLLYLFLELLEKNEYHFFFKEHSIFYTNVNNLTFFLNLLEVFFQDIIKVHLNIKPLSFEMIDLTRFKLIFDFKKCQDIINFLVEIESKLKYNSNIQLIFISILMKIKY